MDKVNTFTSTGIKFLRQALFDSDIIFFPKPLSLQVALTERCNLRCSFCSVVNRKRKYEWDINELISATTKFKKLGIKTVEITGGGEPTVYPDFEWYVEFCHDLGLEVGLITNGLLLHKISSDVLNRLRWLRISMNCLDYVNNIEIPKIRGTLGFSYVFGPDSSFKNLLLVKSLAIEHKAAYVRVVPNCLSTEEELKEQHKKLSDFVEQLGHPVFYQQKEYGKSKICRWCLYKPFLYCDELVYPCSSIAINPDADKAFESSYAICHWKDVEEKMYKADPDTLIDTSKCNRCVFQEQNDLIQSLVEPLILHPNFI